MATSLYQIAEKCKIVLGQRMDMQPLISSVIDAYASVVKRAWYENKNDSCGEIEGVFIYTFKNIIPVKDCDFGIYYIDIPSSYLQLPNEMGVNSVSFMKGQNNPFIRTGAASFGIDNTSKAGILGGFQTYFIENSSTSPMGRMGFPKMTDEIAQSENCKILLKLTIALETVEVEQQLNIPPNIVSDIVNIVVQLYMPKPNPVEKIQEDLN